MREPAAKPLNLRRVYLRVAAQLAPERGLASALLLANAVLAALHFLEPWLLGRVIDALASAQARGLSLTMRALLPLVGAWVCVGLVNIGAGVTVSLHADRLSHRRRLSAVSHYFRHVLSMPLAFHTGTHSGRVMKAMLSGSEAMWLIWLGFFRDHAASLIALSVLLPFSLLLEWHLGLLLTVLVLLMRSTTAPVRRVRADSLHRLAARCDRPAAEDGRCHS